METDLSHSLQGFEIDADVHILDIRVIETGENPLIRLVVDTPDGLTAGEATRIARQLMEDPGFAARFGAETARVEVTSPGVDAGLTEYWQYPRHIGKDLVVALIAGPEEKAGQLTGTLVEADEKGVTLKVGAKNRFLAFDEIGSAKVKLQW